MRAVSWRSRMTSSAPRSRSRSRSSRTWPQVPVNAGRPAPRRRSWQCGSARTTSCRRCGSRPCSAARWRILVHPAADLVEGDAERQPAVGPVGDPVEAGARGGGQQDRGTGGLGRLEAHGARCDPLVAGGDVDDRVRPHGAHHVEDLLQPLAPARHRRADGVELVDRPAQPETGDQAAPADLVERGQGAGQQHRRVPRRHQHIGAEPDPLRHRRRHRERHDRVEHDVLGGREPPVDTARVAHRAGCHRRQQAIHRPHRRQPGLLGGDRDGADGVGVGERAEVGETESELHRALLGRGRRVTGDTTADADR